MYATDVKSLFYLAGSEFLCITGCVPHHFQCKLVAFLFFPQKLSLTFLIIRFLTSVGYSVVLHERYIIKHILSYIYVYP